MGNSAKRAHDEQVKKLAKLKKNARANKIRIMSAKMAEAKKAAQIKAEEK